MQVFFALVPLIAFYLAESYYGLQAGVLCAMGFAGLQLAYERIANGRFNKMVLFSAVLVSVLGGLSLLSDDERFVLWTPVVGDLVFAGLVFGGMFLDPPLHERAMREADPELDLEGMRSDVRGLVARFGVNLLLHAALTAWSTTQPREVWVTVSGPVQYGMFGIQLLGEFLWARFVPSSRHE